MSSINKILNDALDQTLLNESTDEKLEENWVSDKIDAGKDRLKKTIDSMGQPGYAGSEGKARDNLRANHPNKDDSSTVDKALQFAKDNWKEGAAGTAAIGAGIGALLLAKKLRAAKKKAAEKKAKA